MTSPISKMSAIGSRMERKRTAASTTMWLVGAAGLGFLASLTFSGWLYWPRTLFLFPYIGLVGGFLALFFRVEGIALRDLARRNWPYGVVGGAVASLLLIRNVLGQPASATPQGLELLGALLWAGLAYGVIDALFLNVMPVMAVRGSDDWGRERGLGYKALLGVVALLASLAVTAAYHLGYAEFRGPTLILVLVGNAIITGSYLLTDSPLAAILSHVAMHIAAVLHGIESTLQLPPHY